jgi:hypothetical protein
MRIHCALVSAALLSPLPAAALCVGNDTEERLYFTVEDAKTGARIGASLGTGEDLCLPNSRKGVVAAFESASSIEGCSRLAVGEDGLLAFARFDRCTWASHHDQSEAAGD